MKKYKKLLKPFRSLDLFNKPVSLLIKDQERHKTYCGAFLTLIIITMMSVLLCTNFINLDKNPRSYQYQIYHQVLNSTQFMNFKILINGLDEQNLNVSTKDGPLSFTQNLYQYSKQVSLYESDQNVQYVIVEISLKNATQVPKQEESLEFQLQIPTFYYDLKDVKDPVKSRIEKIETTLSRNIYKRIDIYMSPFTVISDGGMVFKDETQESVLAYQYHQETYDVGNGQKLLQFRIRLNKTELVNYRSYPKLQQILGEAGGLWNVIFTLAMFFQLPFSNLSYRLQIVNSLFNFSNDDDATTENDKIQIVNEKINEKATSPQQQLDKKIPLCQSEVNIPIVPILKKQKSWSQLNQLNIKKRLYSIQRKSQMITEADTDNQKAHITNEISASIKRFFRVVTKKLNLNVFEYITFQFPKRRNKNNIKHSQFQFAVNRIQKSLDILYIINKLHEVDKLKFILLNKAQIQMFDYLPKPFIGADPQDISEDNFCSLLKPAKTPYQKALEAQQAFKEIITNYQDPINQKLINSMDEPIIDLMKLQLNQDIQILDTSVINQLVQSADYRLDTARQ
ncbi:unnamed protein product (macronuclear) [Paramecium tetraurelia]|uniref:Transmembrane protein n=1 Tax=Paramecium tetraurelia TaxID=5888 RepID=A0D8W6_PARTE|nr:uncharacterized protein GSPATT00014429001 [Paramecium tetraurelia]CAK79483.1 unnamed protein product [Paramecium tetraurelia]|eukprot:XP_001446880.1 hypothetical protein (macronuclear) [Paramecium tetraurelia strain d4-2]